MHLHPRLKVRQPLLYKQERYSDRTQTNRHLSFVVADGGVHLLLVDVLDLGGGAAQDALLLLFGQRLSYHLDGLGPLVPAGHNKRLKQQHAALYRLLLWIHL